MNRFSIEKAFLNYNAFGSIEELVDKVAQIDQNDDLYVSMLCESRYNAVDYEEKKFKGLEEFLFHIFDQEKEQAYRRPRYYRSYWHEVYLEEYHNAVNTLPFKLARKLGAWKSRY